MSRSGYSDDIDNWQLIKWRGQVTSAIRGKRGQQLLKDLLAALDAMPVKELIAHELVTDDGAVCALGALGKMRGIDMSTLDPDEPEYVAAAFGVACPLICEIVYMNDEPGFHRSHDGTEHSRWVDMRAWVAAQIK